MGALVVVLAAPLLGEDLHLPEGIEDSRSKSSSLSPNPPKDGLGDSP